MARITLSYVLYLGPEDFTQDTLQFLLKKMTGKKIEIIRFKGTKEQYLGAPEEFLSLLDKYFGSSDALLVWDKE